MLADQNKDINNIDEEYFLEQTRENDRLKFEGSSLYQVIRAMQETSAIIEKGMEEILESYKINPNDETVKGFIGILEQIYCKNQSARDIFAGNFLNSNDVKDEREAIARETSSFYSGLPHYRGR